MNPNVTIRASAFQPMTVMPRAKRRLGIFRIFLLVLWMLRAGGGLLAQDSEQTLESLAQRIVELEAKLGGANYVTNSLVDRPLSLYQGKIDLYASPFTSWIEALDQRFKDRLQAALIASAPEESPQADAETPAQDEQGVAITGVNSPLSLSGGTIDLKANPFTQWIEALEPSFRSRLQAVLTKPGPQGPAGPQGKQGNPGPQGPIGLQGKDGAPGADGEDGQDGYTPKFQIGADGSLGVSYWMATDTPRDVDLGNIKGPPGPQGREGKQGTQGPPGPQGETGQRGLRGEPGIQGERGPAGPQGETGPPGPQGPIGVSGGRGRPGSNGRDGAPGAPGADGYTPNFQLSDKGNLVLSYERATNVPNSTNLGNIKGPKGDKGEKGDQGERGEKGDRGEQGLSGFRGQKGTPGVPGRDGANGADGEDGYTPKFQLGVDGSLQLSYERSTTAPTSANLGNIKGPKGDKGERGEAGPQGEQGLSGFRGQKGTPGVPGRDGANGQDGEDGYTPKFQLGADGSLQLSYERATGAPTSTNLGNIKGPQGERGPEGIPGRKGNPGEDGQDGATGPKGDKGDKGNKGDKGDPGITKSSLQSVNLSGWGQGTTRTAYYLIPSDSENKVGLKFIITESTEKRAFIVWFGKVGALVENPVVAGSTTGITVMATQRYPTRIRYVITRTDSTVSGDVKIEELSL